MSTIQRRASQDRHPKTGLQIWAINGVHVTDLDVSSRKPRAQVSLRQKVATWRSLSGRSRRPQDLDQPYLAVLLVTTAMACLAAMAVIVRHLTQSGLDSQVALFWRNVFCVIWLLPLLAVRGRTLVVTARPRLYVIRVVLSFVSMSAFFYALSRIPVGKATAISFLSPIFGTVFAILLLGEVVRARRWVALMIGFFGAMIMLVPSRELGNVSSINASGAGEMAALISAMCVGLIGPLVKQLTSEDDSDRIVFITSLMMTPLSLIPALFTWSWPSGNQWLMPVLLGLFAVLGHMALVRGYSVAQASLVMTFKFSRVPFAVGLAYLFFGETIAMQTWIGALLIFAAGLYIARREATERS